MAKQKRKIRLLPLMSMESSPSGSGKLAKFKTTGKFARIMKLPKKKKRKKGIGFGASAKLAYYKIKPRKKAYSIYTDPKYLE